MSSDAAADQHRRLADALEAAEEAGVDVDGVESYTLPSGELVASIDVEIGEETGHIEPSTEEADAVEGDDSAADPTDEQTSSAPIESEIDHGDLKDEEGDFDPDEAVERLDKPDEDSGTNEDYIGTESGLRDELDEFESEEDDEPETLAAEDDDQPNPDELEADEAPEPPADSLAGEVLATLRDEGELAGPEIKTITGAGSDMYTAISELDEDGLVEKRKDPDDGRRTLYRPAGWLVEGEDEEEVENREPEWDGRDPDTIVADSSLPATIVLEDILDAAAGASTVRDVAETLDVSVAELDPALWELNLKELENRSLVDDVDEQVETIQRVVGA